MKGRKPGQTSMQLSLIVAQLPARHSSHADDIVAGFSQFHHPAIQVTGTQVQIGKERKGKFNDRLFGLH